MNKKAFIRVIEPEEAEGALKRAYKRVGGSRGNIANVHQCQSLNPKAMLAHLDLYMSLMYDEKSELSRKERELIATVVSVVNNCDYCIVHHYEALKTYWEDAPSPREIVNGRLLSRRELAIVYHSRKLVETPNKIIMEDIEVLQNNGFTDKGILDLTMIVGYFCFVNRLTLGIGVALENKEHRDYKY